MLTNEDRKEVAAMLLVLKSGERRTSKRLDTLIRILVKKNIITKETAAMIRSY